MKIEKAEYEDLKVHPFYQRTAAYGIKLAVLLSASKIYRFNKKCATGTFPSNSVPLTIKPHFSV